MCRDQIETPARRRNIDALDGAFGALLGVEDLKHRWWPVEIPENMMAIREGGVRASTVGDLIEENLRIPHYKRPYSWEPATALQLVDNIYESRGDPLRPGTPYVLGPVILHAHDNVFDVVDGRQRLLTLRMLITLLGCDSGDGLRRSFRSDKHCRTAAPV